MQQSIDLNLDGGESLSSLFDGREEALYRLVSSVNIACGGHAGDRESMRASIALAQRFGVRIGAHPSYPDRAGFGRVRLALSEKQLRDSLLAQLHSLKSVWHEFLEQHVDRVRSGESNGESNGDRNGQNLRDAVDRSESALAIGHVKLHGALYNEAAHDETIAEIVLSTLHEFDHKLKIFALAGSPFLHRASAWGFSTVAEAFADRRYERDGSLRDRTRQGALISDPREAAEQALRIARGEGALTLSGERVMIHADTICIHGDSEDSVLIAQSVRSSLERAGISISSPI